MRQSQCWRTSCQPRTRRDVQAAGAAIRDTTLLQRLNDDDERSDNEVLHGEMVDRKHGQDEDQ